MLPGNPPCILEGIPAKGHSGESSGDKGAFFGNEELWSFSGISVGVWTGASSRSSPQTTRLSSTSGGNPLFSFSRTPDTLIYRQSRHAYPQEGFLATLIYRIGVALPTPLCTERFSGETESCRGAGNKNRWSVFC